MKKGKKYYAYCKMPDGEDIPEHLSYDEMSKWNIIARLMNLIVNIMMEDE